MHLHKSNRQPKPYHRKNLTYLKDLYGLVDRSMSNQTIFDSWLPKIRLSPAKPLKGLVQQIDM